jgi:predicted RNase H-like HicB family nuclease
MSASASPEDFMKYAVIIHSAEEGGYWSEVPAIPGCGSQGETLEAVKRNTAEAIEGCVQSLTAEAKKRSRREKGARVLALAV